MNYSRYYPLLFILFLPALLAAQVPESGAPNAEKRILKGILADAESQIPLAYATVTLFSLPDSAAVTGAITDETGMFEVMAKPGKYFLRAQFLSYKTKFVDGIALATDTDLGAVLLTADATTLDEVVIRAEKSQVQFDLDKTVFNVGKDLANRGGSAADVLDNVPSVQVDAEGNVSLRGSENVRILVDGKPSGLVSFGSNGLQNLPANMIDRVEVITNPSARYEAEGMAGIINIVLKKENRRGINGSVDLTAGTPDEHGIALNMNLRRNKFNFFTNYGLRYQDSPGSNSMYQEYYSGDTTFITDLRGERQRAGWSNNLRLGADYSFTPKSTLTSAFSWRYSDQDNYSLIRYYDFINDLNNPVGITRRTDNEKETEPNYEYSLTYKRSFGREGHELSADFRFQDNSEREVSDFREIYFTSEEVLSGQPDLLQRSDNREGERNAILQLDYVHPFGKDGKWEAGLRSGLRNINNDYIVEEFADNAWTTLPGLSNNVLYGENIHAAYGIVGNKLNKLSWQAGLRTELADIKTELKQTNEVNDRPLYVNLFPSAHLNYDLPSENAIQVSYSRRIRRPHFRELNPFSQYTDARNFWGGNPNLNPEYTDAWEIGHLKRWEKGSLSSSVYYQYTTDVIERIRIQLSDTSAITRPTNLAVRHQYGFSFNGNYEPFSVWKLTGNLNFFRSIMEGEYEGQVFDADTYTWFGRVSSRLTLLKKVDLQTTFNYRAPRQTTQGRAKAMYHADLAASTDVLNKNGTLTLSVRDVFNTRRWRSTTEGADFYTDGDFQWRARQVTLTFSYRLNQQKKPEREREGGENGGGDY
ncbi:MAG: TonB-dependent receptor [Haliscomenobacteraceae bacterium CHB4]|nr:TonB-dependent receptor [Haliscomenobacteraceae bacterium CHB4]